MSLEEDIRQELVNKFAYLESNFKIPRQRRVFTEVKYENFREVFEYVAKQMKFPHLCAITGLDERDNLSFIYHLAHDSGLLFNIKTSVSKNNPVINTVTQFFAGADIYEREIADLFGVKIEGLASGNRYPLPDNWPVGQYPLRKDWKPGAE